MIMGFYPPPVHLVCKKNISRQPYVLFYHFWQLAQDIVGQRCDSPQLNHKSSVFIYFLCPQCFLFSLLWVTGILTMCVGAQACCVTMDSSKSSFISSFYNKSYFFFPCLLILSPSWHAGWIFLGPPAWLFFRAPFEQCSSVNTRNCNW